MVATGRLAECGWRGTATTFLLTYHLFSYDLLTYHLLTYPLLTYLLVVLHYRTYCCFAHHAKVKRDARVRRGVRLCEVRQTVAVEAVQCAWRRSGACGRSLDACVWGRRHGGNANSVSQ